MDERDVVRLRHMLEAARQALAFASGKTRQSLDDDLMLVFALTRAIEIIGEAAAMSPKRSGMNTPKSLGLRSLGCVTASFMPILTST